ncbi:MAG: uridine diphosphate-N-acetylglucosamine-binding protein YvcK [Chloroflexota bacterium]
MSRVQGLTKWLTPGIGVKRWIILMLSGILLVSLGLTYAILLLLQLHIFDGITPFTEWGMVAASLILGLDVVGIAVFKLSHSILTPYRKLQQGRVVDVVYAHKVRQKGLKLVALGGGTGLPSVLRGLKPFTSNITAVVTVADDGGSSGRLRRELGVLPPGDLRNNIAALADDESLMTKLFQYRFNSGDLGGHAFGNLFISALAGVTGSIETALVETERVLNIQGRVLPATLEDVNLVATVHIDGSPPRKLFIQGESDITKAGGRIEQIGLEPPDVQGYSESIQAILDADIVVIGPGSLFTSILPNLLVKDVAEALRATSAYKLYVCNVAMQPGETDNFTVAEHILALEQHIGRGMFQVVLANDTYPKLNAGNNTRYVLGAPEHHEVLQRYEVRYTDLTDTERPWRHDPQKLAQAILKLREEERAGSSTKYVLTQV